MFNTICRRPHLPREKHVQDIMVDLGISISKKIPEPESDLDVEENGEEEYPTDDEELEFQGDDDMVDPKVLEAVLEALFANLLLARIFGNCVMRIFPVGIPSNASGGCHELCHRCC